MTQHVLLATCPKGLGSLLSVELDTLGAESVRELPSGVAFKGTLAVAYRACLWSRLANRILLQVTEFAVASDADLHAGTFAVPWEQHLTPSSTLAIDFSGTSDAIRNTQFGAQRVKDGIVDAFRSRGMDRPSVDLKQPDIRISARLHRGRVVLSLDLSGDSLHRRGYRLDPGKAPLKENLAAAVVQRSGWLEAMNEGGSFIDPMCGSGTLLIEAALIALDRAPALNRQRFGFQGWRQHNSQQWHALLAEAGERARDALPAGVEIRGYDGDVAAVRRAEENIARLGLQRVVRCRAKSIAELTRPSHTAMDHGVVVCNPPWGERISQASSLSLLYRSLGELFDREFRGWKAAVLTTPGPLGRAIGLRSHRKYAFQSGPIDLNLLLFDLAAENRLADIKPRGSAGPTADSLWPEQPRGGQQSPALTDGATMVANRMRKNRKRLRAWIKRDGIDAYRLYDADIPEYAVAVDVYAGHPHVAEYAAPKDISDEVADRRLEEACAAVRELFDLAADKPLALKRRQRQRGDAQYGRHGSGSERIPVREGGVKVLVNLHDYLDTGLFLDHRPLRMRIAAEARGKHFLNLFCYTGAATLHAAAGGAATSTSVDLSNTYLEWFRDNLALNGFSERQHRAERADVVEWLQTSDRHWDLILLDPPSFSNSKAMTETFDVQRDHRPLIDLAMARLAENGVLYFSNNRRRFKIDPQLGERWRVEDVTDETLPPDFQRGAPSHRCWRVTHA